MKINLMFVRKNYRPEIISAINLMCEEFPVLENIVKVVHVRFLPRYFKRSFATAAILGFRKKCIQYEIKLNPYAFSFYGIMFKIFSVEGANYCSIQDIIIHEFGHCLQLFIVADKLGIDILHYKWRKWRKYKELTSEKTKEFYKSFFEDYYNRFGWSKDDAINYLWTSAVQNPWESLPECFNNYYRLRLRYPDLTPMELETYRFTKMVVDEYRSYIPAINKITNTLS